MSVLRPFVAAWFLAHTNQILQGVGQRQTYRHFETLISVEAAQINAPENSAHLRFPQPTGSAIRGFGRKPGGSVDISDTGAKIRRSGESLPSRVPEIGRRHGVGLPPHFRVKLQPLDWVK